jgi:hypothetical protein
MLMVVTSMVPIPVALARLSTGVPRMFAIALARVLDEAARCQRKKTE